MSDPQAAIALACERGISFQAARSLLAHRHDRGDPGGRVARPSVPSEAALLEGEGKAPADSVTPGPGPIADSGKLRAATSTELTGDVDRLLDRAFDRVFGDGQSRHPFAPAPCPPPSLPSAKSRPCRDLAEGGSVSDQPNPTHPAGAGPSSPPFPPSRADELTAMEQWLAANPVRREPDYGDVQDEYRILVAAGYSVARAKHRYVVNDWQMTKEQFKAKARKVKAGGAS